MEFQEYYLASKTGTHTSRHNYGKCIKLGYKDMQADKIKRFQYVYQHTTLIIFSMSTKTRVETRQLKTSNYNETLFSPQPRFSLCFGAIQGNQVSLFCVDLRVKYQQFLSAGNSSSSSCKNVAGQNKDATNVVSSVAAEQRHKNCGINNRRTNTQKCCHQ